RAHRDHCGALSPSFGPLLLAALAARRRKASRQALEPRSANPRLDHAGDQAFAPLFGDLCRSGRLGADRISARWYEDVYYLERFWRVALPHVERLSLPHCARQLLLLGPQAHASSEAIQLDACGPPPFASTHPFCVLCLRSGRGRFHGMAFTSYGLYRANP